MWKNNLTTLLVWFHSLCYCTPSSSFLSPPERNMHSNTIQIPPTGNRRSHELKAQQKKEKSWCILFIECFFLKKSSIVQTIHFKDQFTSKKAKFLGKIVVTKSSLIRNDKQLIRTVVGRWFPAGLQVFHDTLCHACEFFLHLKELASWIAIENFRGQLSSKGIDLAQKICWGLAVCIQDNWFNQIWKGRKGRVGRAGQAVVRCKSQQNYVVVQCCSFCTKKMYSVHKVFVEWASDKGTPQNFIVDLSLYLIMVIQ